MRACGYETKVAFAAALGEDAQNVHHWMTRDKPGTGAPKIRALTGVSVDWLLDGDGEPVFPNGPKLGQSAAGAGANQSMALTLNRIRNDVQALRYVVAALVETLIATTPAAADGMTQLLAEVEQRFQGIGFVGQIQSSVAESQQQSAKAPAAAPLVRRADP